jgi:hypothetical protein
MHDGGSRWEAEQGTSPMRQAEQAIVESFVRSWGRHDDSGLSISMVREAEQLIITVKIAVPGLPDLEPFVTPYRTFAPLQQEE